MGEPRRRFLQLGAGATLGGGVLTMVSGQHSRSQSTAQQPPRVLVAGSLLALAEDILRAQVEAHGSLAVRQLILDEARQPDIAALADPTLFRGITDRITLFATNALVLAYNPDSDYANAIRSNWAEALSHDDLVIGRSDPKTDPLGYRTVLALKLAERYGIADRSILARSEVFPETALMRNLEQGAVDTAFVYRNMAVEHNYPFIDLPGKIDFSDPTRADEYATVSLTLDQRTIRGRPIRYAAARLSDGAQDWFQTLVEDADRLRNHGFTVPPNYPTKDQL